MIHLFLNCDEYLAALEIAAIKRAFVAQAVAAYAEGGRTPTADERATAQATAQANTVEMDGGQMRGPEILAAALTVSLFAEPRLVIVRGYLAALRERMARSKDSTSAAFGEYRAFVAALADLPAETGLVLLDTLGARKKSDGDAAGKERGDLDLKVLMDALAKGPPGSWKVHNLPTPAAGGRDRALEQWVEARAAGRRLQLRGNIVSMLVDRIGPDLRRMDNELEKLSLFAGDRPISDADVRMLVADTGEEAIWGLTDGLSERNSAKAFHTLAQLWQDDLPPFNVLGSIAANYRTILRVKAAAEGGERNPAVIMKAVGARSEYPVKKALGVASRYTFGELEEVVERLFEANLAMVTGADAQMEIELLVADLTLKPRGSRP